VDADTGNVVDAGNDRTPMPPASLSKVITALTASNLAPSTPITVSARAAAAPADKLFMKAGQVWTADQMMHSLLISSANDAAVSLAEEVGGSLEGFQPIFARTALSLGMADHPVLVDPAGLDGPDGLDGGNLLSARDLAMAGRALLAVPSLAAIVAVPVYYFDGPDNVHHRLTNHNKLFLTTYAGAIGIKTGYTRRAGTCIMAAARVGGRTMLAVVLNSTNPTLAAKLLLDKGFATPVAAETTTDQLPGVNLAAVNQSSSGSGPSAGSGTSVPASPVANPGLAAPPAAFRPAAAAAVTPQTTWASSFRLLSVAGAVALLLCLALVMASVGRRRHLRR
jgi:D-alanyl-D-alanine carboxypeptidase